MRFYQFMGCIAAFLIAAWAFVITLFMFTFGLVPVSFTVVLAHALVLGLPIFLIFRWKRWVNPITCNLLGFLAAAASGVVPRWPSTATNLALRTNARVGGVQTYIDGVPTAAAWLDFARDLIFLGVFGGTAGIVFFAILFVTGALAPADKGADRSQRRLATSLGVIAVLITGTLVAIPDAVWGRLPEFNVDRTCHNTLRDDRNWFPSQVQMRLEITDEEGLKLKRAMEEFAATHKMSFRDNVPGIRLISLCNDRGVTIKLHDLRHIAVIERQPDSGWQQTTKELIDRIETMWPGKLRFADGKRGEMPRPRGTAMTSAFEANDRSRQAFFACSTRAMIGTSYAV